MISMNKSDIKNLLAERDDEENTFKITEEQFEKIGERAQENLYKLLDDYFWNIFEDSIYSAIHEVLKDKLNKEN